MGSETDGMGLIQLNSLRLFETTRRPMILSWRRKKAKSKMRKVR